MKGIVFREFMQMVEDQFLLETADAIIESSKLASPGPTLPSAPILMKRWWNWYINSPSDFANPCLIC